jgi:hypothetical protein
VYSPQMGESVCQVMQAGLNGSAQPAASPEGAGRGMGSSASSRTAGVVVETVVQFCASANSERYWDPGVPQFAKFESTVECICEKTPMPRKVTPSVPNSLIPRSSTKPPLEPVLASSEVGRLCL